MRDVHTKVLRALVEHYRDCEDFCFVGFAGLAADTGLERSAVRRSCRFLARKGLAKFGHGLWTEDGEPAGSGYCATEAGVEFVGEEQQAGEKS